MYRQGSQTTDPDGVSWDKKHKRFLTYGTTVLGQYGAYIWPKSDGALRMVGPGGIEFSHMTGSGLVVMQTSPIIITPTIADLSNMQHDHSDELSRESQPSSLGETNLDVGVTKGISGGCNSATRITRPDTSSARAFLGKFEPLP